MATEDFKKTITTLDGLAADIFGSDQNKRIELRDAVRRLLARVETPFETACRWAFDQPVVFAGIQTLLDMGLWEAWTKAGGGQKTLDELVKLLSVECETNFIRRLLRLLVSYSMVGEVSEDKYEPTPFSLSLGDANDYTARTIQAGTHHYLGSTLALPEYYKKMGYKQSVDPNENNYVHAYPEKLTFFGRCGSDPAYYGSFGGHMAGWTKWKRNWTDTFDTKTLLNGAKLDSGPLVVDMGGHVGIDISRVLEKHPDLPAGALVLQDLPQVIETAKVDSKITKMAHDFTTPQPVKGSRAYFFHAVMHDWPNSTVVQILETLKPALVKGYSKVLIYDMVVPRTGASSGQAVMDVYMMQLLSSGERTEADWTKLLGQAGFKVIKFWPDGIGLEGVVEAELAD